MRSSTDSPGGAGAAAIVLVGGAGSRLGGMNKALIRDALGVSALEHIYEKVAPLIDEPLILAGRARFEHALPEGSYRWAFDSIDTQQQPVGPLAGLIAGLREASSPVCYLLAVDMLWLEVEFLRALRAIHCETGAAAVMARRQGRWEPLPALVSRRKLCALQAAWDAGERSIGRALAGLGAEAWEEGDWRAAGLSERSFESLNEPAQLERWLRGV